MDLRRRKEAQTDAEGPVGGPSKAGRTATGTKMGENVALAGQEVRQWRNLGPKRGSSGTCRALKHSGMPRRPLRWGLVCFNGARGERQPRARGALNVRGALKRREALKGIAQADGEAVPKGLGGG